MLAKGVKKMKVWKFGKDINTDLIIPARYLNTVDTKELASHVMEDTDNEDFKKFYDSGNNSVKGDVFVADDNFGCGSSREHAPIAIKESGISYVIAPSFARIFYRNAFNIGLIAIECPEAKEIQQRDNLEVLLKEGVIKNTTQNREHKFTPIPYFMKELTDAGGLMEYRAKQMGYAKK